MTMMEIIILNCDEVTHLLWSTHTSLPTKVKNLQKKIQSTESAYDVCTEDLFNQVFGEHQEWWSNFQTIKEITFFLFQSDLETIKLETIKGRNHEQIYIYNLKPIYRQSNWKRWRKKLEMLKPRSSFYLHADFYEYDIFDHQKKWSEKPCWLL